MNSDISKYQNADGTHRVPLWRIGGFALNNTATNLYMFLMNYLTYYLVGWVGVLMVTASSFAMFMRIWDGVTDPFIGFTVDKTNGKFGKNRPFMVIGNVILFVTSCILFHVTHLLGDPTRDADGNLSPGTVALRFGFFIVIAAIYYVGYTFQCVVTKSAQTCLTNDPKQRPLFTCFDAVYNVILFAGFAVIGANLSDAMGGYGTTEFFHWMWVIVACTSAVFTCIAIISIWPKDRTEFFGTGKPIKVGMRDYWETLKGNRAIQMLVVSASSDKLAASAKTSVVTVIMFAIVAGENLLSGIVTGMTAIPTMILSVLFVGSLATMLGQRKAMLIGSWGGIVCNALLAALWLFGNPRSMNNGNGGLAIGFFAIAHIGLSILQGGFQGVSGNIVIPMTADCADYEVYRTGKYVPGMMGTLFSFVDKIISSLAPMIAGLMLAAIGFTNSVPDIDTPYSDSLLYVGVFLSYGIVIIGLLCNLVALKFYPLTKEKMEEIQDKIAEIKAKALAEN